MKHCIHFRERVGFSLLELSVVIGIIALIAGVGMTMAMGALKAADRVTTQERLNTIKLAIDSYVKTYGVYPCPSGRNITPTDPLYGVARASCAAAGGGVEYSGVNGVSAGGVPVRSLGLPDSYAGDAWGNKLSYVVTTQLTTDPSRVPTRAGLINIRFGPSGSDFNTTQQLTSTTFSAVNDSGGAAVVTVASTSGLMVNSIVHLDGAVYDGSYTVSAILAGPPRINLGNPSYIANDSGTVYFIEAGTGAAYVVVSHGPDGRGAFPVGATSVPTNKLCNNSLTPNSSPPPCTSSGTTSCRDIENCETGGALDGTFSDTTYNDGSTATVYFDDYIVWGSNWLMRAPINSNIYIGSTENCPTGICESWCAACVNNYPHTSLGGTTTIPPATFDHATVTSRGITLCKKVITSNATTCQASCFWSGQSNTPNLYKCP